MCNRLNFCEQVRDIQFGPVLRLLFQTPTFKVNIIPDVAGPELYVHPFHIVLYLCFVHMALSAGALKNVVALAVGFVAGLKQEEQVLCIILLCVVCAALFRNMSITSISVEQQGGNHSPRPH